MTKAILKVVVEYSNDEGQKVSFSDVNSQLSMAAERLSGEGLLSGDLDAQIETWDYSIEEVPELESLMKVRVICGAANAYACIQTPTKSLDILLSGGRSAIDSLRQSIKETQSEIDRRVGMIRHMEAAINVLEAEKKEKAQ